MLGKQVPLHQIPHLPTTPTVISPTRTTFLKATTTTIIPACSKIDKFPKIKKYLFMVKMNQKNTYFSLG